MAQEQNRAVSTAVAGPVANLRAARRALGRLTRRNPNMMAGIAVLAIMVLVALMAPVLFTGDPKEINTRDRFVSPSVGHWFGTDNVGRDVYTRVIYGSRVSLIVGFSVALICTSAAVVIGLAAGYARRADAVIMRVADGLMSIPGILLAMALVALLGGSVQNVIIALALVETPRSVRVVRASVLSLREQMFVDAALALGASTRRILAFHILPNAMVPLIVQGTFVMASAILIEASLGFLGLGPPEDVATWGNMMARGGNYISRAVWIILFPGIFLTLTVLGINLAGDGLRDVLDPKLRHTV